MTRYLTGMCVLGIVLATRVAAAPFEWQTAKPEEVGLSPQRIEALRAALAAKGTSGLLIIRHDRIACEWYDGKVQTVDKPHGTASLAKSLVGGMSLAAAMDEGKIRPDDLAAKYVPQWAGDAKKSKITVAELATHTSGLEDAEQGGIAH
jgi:CubicO group peptidase (beta-lactamase class C family)